MAGFTALVILALRFGDNPHVLRWSAPVRFFGYISYGLYLLHLLFLSGYDRLVAGTSMQSDVLTAPLLGARLIAVLVGGGFICFLSRRFFEEYFLKMKEKLAPYEGKRDHVH